MGISRCTSQPNPCLEGVGFVVHVLAVEVHGGLQPQGVPRPQAAGGNTAIQQKLPELLSVVGVEQQFCTVFAGVARASTEHRLAQAVEAEHPVAESGASR
jgi:hypothetical protein